MPHLLPSRARCAATLAAALLSLLPCASAAQTTSEAKEAQEQQPISLSTPDHPYVLHVYTDLLQIPALVLAWNGKPKTQLTLQNFKLQLDSGPAFRPTALHIEGNEPLSLALVLDASGAEDALVSALAKSPTHGLPQGLLPQDRLAVYAFDCKSLRVHLDLASASLAAADGVSRLLASPSLHPPNNPAGTCRDTRAVWDAVGAAALDLGSQPGRRALILISDGSDAHSKTTPQSLLDYAVAHSIAIFVLREPPSLAIGFGSRPRMPEPASAPAPAENSLQDLTTHSGGMVIDVLGKGVNAELDRVVTLLRSRYILQFPRPSNGSAGTHRLDVKVSDRGAQVYAAGIAVPLRDPARMSDPNTVPADTSRMPVQGARKR